MQTFQYKYCRKNTSFATPCPQDGLNNNNNHRSIYLNFCCPPRITNGTQNIKQLQVKQDKLKKICQNLLNIISASHILNYIQNCSEAKSPASQMLGNHNCSVKYLVNVQLTGEKTMKQLNLHYRNKNQATDVLSFAKFNRNCFDNKFDNKFDNEFDSKHHPKNKNDKYQYLSDYYPEQPQPTNCPNHKQNYHLVIELGDVAICPKIILQQSEQLNLTFFNHSCHIIVHGILHLIGFDHVKKNDALIMQNLENSMLSNSSINIKTL